MSLTVTHEPDVERFTARAGDELRGWIVYDRVGSTMRLLHAEVPPLMRGKGVGGEVVRAVLDHLRASSTDRVLPLCGFVVTWLRRNPEYADLTTR